MKTRMTLTFVLFLTVTLSAISCGPDEKGIGPETLFAIASQLDANSSGNRGTTSDTASMDTDTALVRANDAMTSDSASGSSFTRDVIPAEGGELARKQIGFVFLPVRFTIQNANDIIEHAALLIESINSVIDENPEAIGLTIAFQSGESSDPHPQQVARISTSKTFSDVIPGTGLKGEFWWYDTGSDPAHDGKKFMEIDYVGNGDGDAAGVMFFRFPRKDTESSSSPTYGIVRLEFQYDASTNSGKTVVHMDNMYDEIAGSSNEGAYFLSKDENGNISVDGIYTLTGLEQPFKEDGVSTLDGWDSSDKRAYIFDGAGSDDKAVVQLVLPLTSDTSVATSSDLYKDGQKFSLGTLWTTGLLNKMNETDDSNTDCISDLGGTPTELQCFNHWADVLSGGSVTALTVNSTQDDFNNVLTTINDELDDDRLSAMLTNLIIITGIKNPVYFLADENGPASIIGQDNTDDLDTIPAVGTDGKAEYDTLGKLLRKTIRGAESGEEGGDFSPEGILALDLTSGSSVVPLDGNPDAIKGWNGIDDSVPTIDFDSIAASGGF